MKSGNGLVAAVLPSDGHQQQARNGIRKQDTLSCARTNLAIESFHTDSRPQVVRFISGKEKTVNPSGMFSSIQLDRLEAAWS